MAMVTKGNEGKEPMADDRRSDGEEREEEREREVIPYRGPAAPEPSRGFLRIYKPGQGYWTRLLTAIGAAVVLIAICAFTYRSLKVYTPLDWYKDAAGVAREAFPYWKIGIVGVFGLTSLVFLWRYLNKPAVVDFFIATESEMKKVNWTSRRDLIGSTKVVIAFMFLIAAILFLIDVFFGYFFQLITVLKSGPFG